MNREKARGFHWTCVLIFGLFCGLSLLTSCGGGGDGGGGPSGIGPNGGIVTSSDGNASVNIPAGALSQETAITVASFSNPPSGNVGTAYEFGPNGTTFTLPVTISITYDEANLPSSTNELDLKLAILINNQWQEVPGSSVNTTSNTVTGTTTSFSIYGVIIVKAPTTALMIDAFRLRGPNGANDEYIQVYNSSTLSHTVAAISGTGYAVAASDGVARCTIPNGTVITARGHFLCVNSVGYSLASYPAGNGTTATGDVTYTTDIPDNAGIALFNNNTGGGSFILANRLDAVGSTSEANTLYKEGTGYPALTPFSIDYSWVRDTCGKGGSITAAGACPAGGVPVDTGNNLADFYFVDTNGTSAGGGQRLGAPGPQNLGSPVMGPTAIASSAFESCVADTGPPNRVRDFTSDPANNSTFGTLDIRRTFTNNTGANITRLRFRVIDLTTFPAPSGTADLRPRTSTAVVVTVDRVPCGSGTSNVTVQGTTLEQPPSQPNGGGFYSSLSAGTVTLATPLANGATIDVRFLMGIQQTGNFRLGIVVEALPSGGTIFEISGSTQLSCIETRCLRSSSRRSSPVRPGFSRGRSRLISASGMAR